MELTVGLLVVRRLTEKARAPLRCAGSEGDTLQHCEMGRDGWTETYRHQIVQYAVRNLR